MGAIFGLAQDVEGGLEIGLSSGFFFGLGMSLTLGTLQISKTKEIAAGGNVSPRQTKTVYLDMSLAAAFDRCLEALNKFGARTKSEDREQGRIEAITSKNWRSWSEIILMQLTNQNTGQVGVQVSSSPKLKSTLLDYGKGYENVERITGLLTEDPDKHRP